MSSDGALIGLGGGVFVVLPWCFHGALMMSHMAFTVLSRAFMVLIVLSSVLTVLSWYLQGTCLGPS